MVSLYDPNVPTGRVDLDTDYLNLQNNFGQLDTTFGIDHYKFSEQTGANGYHNKVTTPLIIGGVHPTTLAATPIFYAMKDGTNGETIHYSRAGLDAVPSPVTYIQSQAVPINMLASASINIYDFTGLTRAVAQLYILSTGSFNLTRNFIVTVWWDGTTFLFNPNQGTSGLFVANAGNILTLNTGIGAATNGISWTLQLLRVQT